MKKTSLFFILTVLKCSFSYAQTVTNDFYNVKPAVGNGIRFWSNDAYKIHMGNAVEYKFGPVTDYSIKTNMSNTPGRGWTWGVTGAVPVAAINIAGDMQIKGNFVSNGSLLFNGTTGTTPVTGAGTRMMWIPSLSAFRAGKVDGTQWDVIGQYSAAFGHGSIASGGWSFAAGAGTTASGITAFAMGVFTKATGNVAATFGVSNVAQSQYSFVIGQFNYNPGTYKTDSWVSTDPLFVVGNGTSSTATSNAVMVLKSGNVLINKVTQLNSTYKLDVNGIIRANEVVINTTGADFVFEKEYTLMSLEILEQNINKNKHLPGIPSACEMQTNGVSISELNISLLQKVEELTLYIIEQNKRIGKLEQQILVGK